MIGWEKALKVGRGIEIFYDKNGKNIIKNEEIGYAKRIFFKDKVLFSSSSNPFLESETSKENLDCFFLPNTIGDFQPKVLLKYDLKSLEDLSENIKKEILNYNKNLKILKLNLSYSEFYFELQNSSAAEVSLKNYSINGFAVLSHNNFLISFSFISNQDLSISLTDYLLSIEPYFHLPLFPFDLKPSRLPVLLFPNTLSFIFENLKEHFLKGSLPNLPDGFLLKDKPFLKRSPNFFPIDGEGSLKNEFIIKNKNIPYDVYSGFLEGQKTTSNSLRNSIYNPPEVGFHNIVLEGLEGDPKNLDSYVAITFPKKIEEMSPFFILNAEGFLYKKNKITNYLPSIYTKFTLNDFFSGFYFIKKPLLFYSSTTSCGVPFLFLRGLSIYPVL